MVEVADPWLVDIPSFQDDRGFLQVLDNLSTSVFLPQRIFVISDVPNGVSRGAHAHKKSWQLLITLNGSAFIEVENHNFKGRFELSPSKNALCVPPLNWLEIKLETKETHLLVLASENYDVADYILERFG